MMVLVLVLVLFFFFFSLDRITSMNDRYMDDNDGMICAAVSNKEIGRAHV